jgi:hypothetical protein
MGKLVQVATETVTSAVASVEFVSKINTDDVYMVSANNVTLSTDGALLYMVLMIDSTPQTTSNYDKAGKLLRTSTTFGNVSEVNNTIGYYDTILGTATQEQANFIYYLYNLNNSSEYSFFTLENVFRSSTAELRGLAGGGVYTVAEAHNGLKFYANSGNIASGTFTLYKVL